MLNPFIPTLTLLAALGSAIVGGVLLAFSSFVMSALVRLPPSQGVAAMQAINVTVINPVFMTIFFGTGAVCLSLAFAQSVARGLMDAALVVTASLAYLIGCLGVTIAFNVPLNDALAALPPQTPETAAYWLRYLSSWTFWNHVRTAAAIAAAAGLTLAFRNGL
jgi:uncharacterized membrane protein